jgi:hypothetical protein
LFTSSSVQLQSNAQLSVVGSTVAVAKFDVEGSAQLNLQGSCEFTVQTHNLRFSTLCALGLYLTS